MYCIHFSYAGNIYIHCTGLSDCLLYWGCQNPLPKDSLLKILLELKKVPSLGESHSPLDPPHLCLFLTFLVSLRVGEADSGLDSSLVDEHYPFLADIHSISLIHQEVTAKSPWNNGGLEAAVKFAWAVFLRECSSLDAFKGKRQREREKRREREGGEKGEERGGRRIEGEKTWSNPCTCLDFTFHRLSRIGTR